MHAGRIQAGGQPSYNKSIFIVRRFAQRGSVTSAMQGSEQRILYTLLTIFQPECLLGQNNFLAEWIKRVNSPCKETINVSGFYAARGFKVL